MTDDQTPTPRSHIVVGVDGSEPSKHGTPLGEVSRTGVSEHPGRRRRVGALTLVVPLDDSVRIQFKFENPS